MVIKKLADPFIQPMNQPEVNLFRSYLKHLESVIVNNKYLTKLNP
jgi:hypothetical protein